MYAARKFAALQLAGKKTWKPFVRVRITRIASAAYEAYGWNGVAYGRDCRALLKINARRNRKYVIRQTIQPMKPLIVDRLENQVKTCAPLLETFR